MPEIARAVAEPIGNVKDITIIDTDGANKLTRMTTNTITQLDAVLQSFTGTSLTEVIGRYVEKKTNGGSPETATRPPQDPAAT